MKNFFKEFKEFITRGNVLDMAVGIIIGGAFTAIITALTSQVLQPLINWLLAGSGAGLESAVTMLKPAYDETGAIDLANSIYIDWGAFITAIINFILVALILFCIVKAINTLRANGKENAEKRALAKKEKAIRKQLKNGEITEEEAEAMIAELYKEPEEEEPEETTADVLKEIRDILKGKSEEADEEEKSE